MAGCKRCALKRRKSKKEREEKKRKQVAQRATIAHLRANKYFKIHSSQVCNWSRLANSADIE